MCRQECFSSSHLLPLWTTTKDIKIANSSCTEVLGKQLLCILGIAITANFKIICMQQKRINVLYYISWWYKKMIIKTYENIQYLEIFPQYHSASDRWLSSQLESHAAIALIMLFLGWSSDHKGNNKKYGYKYRITKTNLEKFKCTEVSCFCNQKAKLLGIVVGVITVNFCFRDVFCFHSFLSIKTLIP